MKLQHRITEEGTTRRGVAGIAALIVLMAASAPAAPMVLGPDDRPLDRAAVLAEADSYWVRDGVNLPVLLSPDGDDHLRLPDLAVARLVVLDAVSGRPVPSGHLRWAGAHIPESLATVDWAARGGWLDIGCRGGEPVELVAEGYRPRTVHLAPQGRRLTVLLEPIGDLEITVRPRAAGHLWLARADEITVVTPFHAAAAKHLIGDDGSVLLRDLDAEAEYEGIVVVPGKAPVVGHITGLPKRLELGLGPGLAVSGRVVDADGRALPAASIEAAGAIESLGGFRYRQQGRADSEGRFTVPGLLAGEITITACAPGHACADELVTLTDGAAAEPVGFRLAAGHDLRLVVQDEFGRSAASATVIDTAAYRRFQTDENGVLIFEGVEPDGTLELEVFGAGLRRWRGRVETDLPEVVLRIPAGGVLEWPILTHHEIAGDEVTATWSRLNDRGREIAEGLADWDVRQQLVRADGLDAGRHRLVVRLPGSATLTSEVVEIGLGEELYLAPVAPDAGLAIGGRVLDGTTGRPVPGARVTCEPGSPHQFRKPHRLDHLQRTLTDADGLFLLEGLDPGSCRAVVRAPGFAGWRRDGVEPDEVGADLGDIVLDHGTTVVGRVLDRSARPQAGVAVEITEDAAYAYFAEATVRSDHDGWFRVESLPVGTWVITARRGEQTARTTIEGRADETVSVELRLGGLRLEGEVWIGERPAAGGALVLSTDGAYGDGVVVMVQTDADRSRLFGVDRAPISIVVGNDGRFVSDGVSAGVYTASYTPPGSGGSPVSRELVIPETDLHRCLIQYSDAGLDGFVVDPDGLPVAGAAVRVQTRDGRNLASGFSDGDGAFAFVGLDPGAVRIGAIHGEFGDADPIELELRTGDTTGPITLELKPPDGAELSLVVRSAAGSLSGAPVYLVGAETLVGFTDGQGIVGFAGVAPDRYRPCAAAYGGAAGCGPEIALGDGDRRDLELELGHGGFVEVLLGPMERLPALRVLTADGIDLTSMLMMVSPPIPGPDGVRLGPLKSDAYRIIVTMPEGPRQGAVEAAEGETAILDLR